MQQKDQVDRRVPDDRRWWRPAHHVQVGFVIVGQDRKTGKTARRQNGRGRRDRTSTAGRHVSEPDETGLELNGPQPIRLVSRYTFYTKPCIAGTTLLPCCSVFIPFVAVPFVLGIHVSGVSVGARVPGDPESDPKIPVERTRRVVPKYFRLFPTTFLGLIMLESIR